MLTPGLVVLQDDPPIDAPTVSKGVVPPELKPVASDIVNKNCAVACIWSSIEKDPDPLLNAEVGIVIFCGVPKTYFCHEDNGGRWKKNVERIRESKAAEKAESLLFKKSL